VNLSLLVHSISACRLPILPCKIWSTWRAADSPRLMLFAGVGCRFDPPLTPLPLFCTSSRLPCVQPTQRHFDVWRRWPSDFLSAQDLPTPPFLNRTPCGWFLMRCFWSSVSSSIACPASPCGWPSAFPGPLSPTLSGACFAACWIMLLAWKTLVPSSGPFHRYRGWLARRFCRSSSRISIHSTLFAKRLRFGWSLIRSWRSY
jgi:hypothetical protein